MSEKTVDVELRSRKCRTCGGVGTLHMPNGEKMDCMWCREKIYISKREWLALGKPANIEEMKERRKNKKAEMPLLGGDGHG